MNTWFEKNVKISHSAGQQCDFEAGLPMFIYSVRMCEENEAYIIHRQLTRSLSVVDTCHDSHLSTKDVYDNLYASTFSGHRTQIHGMWWRHYFYHVAMTPCCAYIKLSSKQIWQNSRYFSRLHCTFVPTTWRRYLAMTSCQRMAFAYRCTSHVCGNAYNILSQKLFIEATKHSLLVCPRIKLIFTYLYTSHRWLYHRVQSTV